MYYKGNEINLGSNLSGKKVLCIGDSITYGAQADNGWTDSKYWIHNYEYYLEKATGCTCYNMGVSGANSYSYSTGKLLEIDWTVDYDVVLIMLGTNQFMEDDDHKDGYNTIIETVQEKTAGKAQVFLICPPYNNYADSNLTHLRTLCDYIKEVAETYMLPCIDLFHEIGWNSYNAGTYLADKIHPNSTGYQLLAEYLANKVDAMLRN